MKIKKQKKNSRALFFNSDKPHCKICGSLLIACNTLSGEFIGLACMKVKSHPQ